MAEYFEALLDEAREHPGDDLVSAITEASSNDAGDDAGRPGRQQRLAPVQKNTAAC